MRPLEMDHAFVERPESLRNILAFWLLGLFNNSSYVIMIAGAVDISASAVGLVYLCAVLPGLILKVTAPYWFHHASYSVRALAAGIMMAGAYVLVALCSARSPQLLGVVLASLQGSLGEASCIALTSRYHSQSTITAWASGTGFAGVFGYAWVAVLRVIGRWTLKETLLAANITVAAWLLVFYILLEPPEARMVQIQALVDQDSDLVTAAMSALKGSPGVSRNRSLSTSLSAVQPLRLGDDEGDDVLQEPAPLLAGRSNPSSPIRRKQTLPKALGKASKIARMSARERLRRTVALWPYMVPLFIVYAAEYAMQTGAWTAIGFPVPSNSESRKRFYVYSNWTYQAGVFLSRSSGMLWRPSQNALWVMPTAQAAFLMFFLADAVWHFWYNWTLLLPCFMTGLLGGAVYVGAFNLIAREVEPQYREFSLAAASLADSAGIALADVAGILIQGCLFKANGIAGADFAC